MIIEKENGFTVIRPDKGKKITTLIPSNKFFELLYLGIEDSVENYIEVTSEEYEEEIDTEETEETIIEKDELVLAKEELIKRSKTKLKNILKNSPVFYEGKYYTCTLEKQNILYNRIKLYEMGDKQGKIMWNATGEESTEWDYENIIRLAHAIENYVIKFVKEQQKEEVEINKCANIEELLEYQSKFLV